MGGCSLAWGATADRATGMRERLALPRSASCPGSASPQQEPAEPGAAADAVNRAAELLR
jgi:hypothetical protein